MNCQISKIESAIRLTLNLIRKDYLNNSINIKVYAYSNETNSYILMNKKNNLLIFNHIISFEMEAYQVNFRIDLDILNSSNDLIMEVFNKELYKAIL